MRAGIFILLLCLFTLCETAQAKSISQEGYYWVQLSELTIKDLNSKYQWLDLYSETEGHSIARYSLSTQSQWFISGLKNGDYQVRLVSDQSPRVIQQFSVQHWPLNQALGLFAFGLIMFIGLIWQLYRFSTGKDCHD